MHSSSVALRFAFCRSLLVYSSGSPPDFRSLLNQKMQSPTVRGTGDRFDGKFEGGSGFLDPSIINQMQETLNSGLTSEMKESMAALFQNAGTSGLANPDQLGEMKMGMMAFGMGENEKGKKVMRGAKLAVDLRSGKVEKDFVEQQVEEDDVSLPKHTVENYDTEGAIEVEFENHNAK